MTRFRDVEGQLALAGCPSPPPPKPKTKPRPARVLHLVTEQHAELIDHDPASVRRLVGAMSVGTITISITKHPSGGLCLTMPHVPHWREMAEGPHGIASALDKAWVEADIALYAKRKGTVGDVEAYDDRVHHTRRAWRLLRSEPDYTPEARPQLQAKFERERAREAQVAAHPVRTQGSRELERARKWTINPDGTWLSPGNPDGTGRRTFAPDTDHVRRISAILTEHGEEPRPTGEAGQEQRPVAVSSRA